jgi:hypothetical protein
MPDVVLGADAFPKPNPVMELLARGGKGTPMYMGGKKGPIFNKKKKQKKQKGKQSSHLRRLRMLNPLKTCKPTKRKREKEDGDDEEEEEEEEEEEPTKRKRREDTSEPSWVRDADKKIMKPHPVILFMREHVPVKPCGRFFSHFLFVLSFSHCAQKKRCKKCRSEPCGKCANCCNNAHLTERSHDRKRCTSLECTRLSEEEIERYRLAHDSADSVAKIESDLRSLRDRFMSATTKGTSADELKELDQDQETLMKRLQVMGKASEAIASEDAPEGYGCLLLSFQTLETERDRVSRLIDRRSTRDSPEIMRTRRQLRNFFTFTICSMVRMFANDVVARPHVEKLREISDSYEKFVRSLPIST